MLKSRIGIWILVIILCVGGTYLIDNVPKWLHTTEINISSNVADANIAENIMDNRYGEYRVKSKSDDYDVIFSMSNETKSGYVLKENMLYTPLVMYVESYVDSYPGGFIQLEDSKYRKKIDLYTVLSAMENGYEWGDIGVHEKVVKGKVTLYIPNQYHWAYSAVEELFYLTLNHGTMPTDEEKLLLKDRVDKLLEKCETVSDLSQAIYDEYREESKSGKVFIGPESIYMTSNGMSGADNTNKFVPIYFAKTTFVYANAYLKTNYSGENLADGFINAIQSKKNFMYNTGWRIKDSTFDIHDASVRLLKIPT